MDADRALVVGPAQEADPWLQGLQGLTGSGRSVISFYAPRQERRPETRRSGCRSSCCRDRPWVESLAVHQQGGPR